jgi:hypothetical protein
MAWVRQALDQEKLHAGKKKDDKNDANLREAQKRRVRSFMLGVVHGRMALRSVDTHVSSPQMWIMKILAQGWYPKRS